MTTSNFLPRAFFVSSILFTQLFAIDRLYDDDSIIINCDQPTGVRLETVGMWVFNGTELDIRNSQKYSIAAGGTELTIRNLQYSDEGNYSCVFVQDGEHFVSFGNVLRIVGTPAFSSCNQSDCFERICAVLGAPVSLDLRTVFINSISMIEGPVPHRTSLCLMENGICTAVIQCNILGGQGLCTPTTDNRFSIEGFPLDVSVTITAITMELIGTYVATTLVRVPSGFDRVLTKTIVVSSMNCGSLRDPLGGLVSVDGCLATYSCRVGIIGGDMTRQCLESDQWSGAEASCSETTMIEATSSASPFSSPDLGTTSSTADSFNEEAAVIIISLSVILPAFFTLLSALVIILVILFLVWKLGKREGRRSVYAPSIPEVIIPNLVGTEHRSIISKSELAKQLEAREAAGWRQSILSSIDGQVELVEQVGADPEAHV